MVKVIFKAKFLNYFDVMEFNLGSEELNLATAIIWARDLLAMQVIEFAHIEKGI